MAHRSQPEVGRMAHPSQPEVGRMAHPVPREGFGMPGTVLKENGKFRAWLGQSRTLYSESSDGLDFSTPRPLLWAPEANASLIRAAWVRTERAAATAAAAAAAAAAASRTWRQPPAPPSPPYASQYPWGEMTGLMTQLRELAQDTLTVMRDEQAPPDERYKAAFTCDRLGHTPWPPFWLYVDDR